jgi:hypothetical protein
MEIFACEDQGQHHQGQVDLNHVKMLTKNLYCLLFE